MSTQTIEDTTTASIEAPIVELQLAPAQPGEAPLKQLAPYDEFKKQIESLRKTAETITVTDLSQTAEMKIARTTRLAIKDIRIAITHRHRELKEESLREGRRIDAGKNELLAVLEPLELRLKNQEEFIERETARIQQEKRVARIAEIAPFLAAPLAIDLGVVLDDRYASMLQDAKDAHAARLAREQKEKEEAEARTKAESEERERIRLENERLKKEAAEREAAAQKEREAAAAALAKEREAIKAKAREQKALDDKIKADLQKRADDEKKAHDEQMAKVKKQIDDAAKAKAEAEANRIAAEKAAAAAPDKEKMLALAATFRAIEFPKVNTEAADSALGELNMKVIALAFWIEKKANELGSEKTLL